MELKTELVTEDSPREEWDALMRRMDKEGKIEISNSIYNYFLEVLPPKDMFSNGFLFAEGCEHYKKFTQVGNKYFVEKQKEIAPLE